MTIKYPKPVDFDKPPSAIIFDTDNTLYPYDPSNKRALSASILKASKLLGVSENEFQEAFDEARKQVKARLGNTASSHSRLLYFQRAIEILGLRSQLLTTLDLEQTYWRTFLNSSELFEGVIDYIEDLRSIGIKTAIITDLTAQVQFRKLIYFGIDTLFDYVVTSEEAGADKPNLAPFELAVQKLGVEMKSCWMIGDSSKADIGGANRCGIFSVQKLHAGVSIAKCSENLPRMFFDSFNDLRAQLIELAWMKREFSHESF